VGATVTKGSLVSDARGASRLAIDLTLLLTDLVETMHHNILRTPGPMGAATFEPTTGITGLVYRSVRGVTRLVGGGIDVVLGNMVPLLRTGGDWTGRDAVLAALNGVVGDYLDASRNPLAITMHLRYQGCTLDLDRAALTAAIPAATGKLLMLAHGLCMNDAQWRRQDHDHGASLARDLAYTPIYLRYNSGRHVSSNGAEFGALLEALVAQWPVRVDEVVIIGHSMGGLVARSACHGAHAAGHRWLDKLRALVFLGTPHHGAPLERGGHWIDRLLGVSPYTAAFTRLGRVRSAGITDLRHGSVLESDWDGQDRFARGIDTRTPLPLPQGVSCFAIAASQSKRASVTGAHPRGDGLVPVASALGEHKDPRFALEFPSGRRSIVYDTGHLELLSSPAVYEQVRHWLAA